MAAGFRCWFLAAARNVVAYSAAVSACEASGCWPQALQLLCAMLLERVAPNVVTLSACVSALEKGREWRRALALLRAMEGHQVRPNGHSYNAAVTACERSSKLSMAMELFEEMEQEQVRKAQSRRSAHIYCAAQALLSIRERWTLRFGRLILQQNKLYRLYHAIST